MKKLKKIDVIIEWSSTIILIIGVMLTSWEMVPFNLWVSLIANILWIYLGFRWKRYSLVIISTIISAIFTAGLIRFYF